MGINKSEIAVNKNPDEFPCLQLQPRALRNLAMQVLLHIAQT